MCDNYGLYSPKDKKILSPRQEENRLARKLEKKVKKQTSASKRGKSNRRNGRNAERELVAWFEKIGLASNLVPMSGALKSANIIKAYLMRQDLFHAFVNGVDIPVASEVEDKGFKIIHTYFNQDNSDIVVISRPYCDRLFYLKENLPDLRTHAI